MRWGTIALALLLVLFLLSFLAVWVRARLAGAEVGLFDLVGHSHQIWHLGVSAAGACWLEGMLEHALWRNEMGAERFCR